MHEGPTLGGGSLENIVTQMHALWDYGSLALSKISIFEMEPYSGGSKFCNTAEIASCRNFCDC